MDNIRGKYMHDILHVRLACKRLGVGAATPVLAAVGADNMELRKLVRIINKSPATIYYNDEQATTTITDGCPIGPGEIETIAVGPGVDLYLIASVGTANVVYVQEGY